MNGKRIFGLPTMPTTNDEAVSKYYVDNKQYDTSHIINFQNAVNTLITNTPISSLLKPTSQVDFNGQILFNLPTPINPDEVATKGYVDSKSLPTFPMNASLFLNGTNAFSDPLIRAVNNTSYFASITQNATTSNNPKTGYSISSNNGGTCYLYCGTDVLLARRGAFLDVFGTEGLQIRTSSTSTFPLPTPTIRAWFKTDGTVDFNSSRLTGITNGTSSTDAVNKSQLDAINSSLSNSITSVNNKTTWFYQQASDYTYFYTGIGIGGYFLRYGGYGYLNGSGGVGYASGFNYYSLDCSYRIKAPEFNAYSSIKKKRILNNSKDIEDKAVDIFRNIPLYEYEYIDKIKEGKAISYGVVAEELQKVLPEYVDMECEDYVPNIFSLATIKKSKNNEYTIKLKEQKDLKIEGEKLRILFNELETDVVIKLINKTEIIVESEKQLQDGKIFVYGTYEKCPSVTKQKIFELSMVVVQNLLSRVEKLEQQSI